MPSKRCCCGNTCLIGEDDFNRADGDPGPGWFGEGVIAGNLLESDADRTTICHPSYAPLGTFWSQATMRNAADGSAYVIKVGDPASNYRVYVTFAGALGVDGMITVRVEDGTDFEEWEYVWELEDETITICWQPEVQLSAGIQTRTYQSPFWVTMCVDTTGERCWTV